MAITTKSKSTRATSNHIIRDPDFADRLTKACDGHPHIPPKFSGRLTWIQRELLKRYKLKVSVETVRKWFAGEAKPRPEKLNRVAQLLEVDVAWLSLGLDPDLNPRERKVRNAMADGVVNVVAGLIQMDGGRPAFPTTQKNNVDLHAIIKGAQYDFHVSLGQLEGKKLRFFLPTGSADLLVLGVIIRPAFSIEIVEITADLVQKGVSHGGSVEVILDEQQARKHRVVSFADRL